MTFALHIWDPALPGALPKNIEQALQISARLADEPAAPGNPRFIAVAEDVTWDFPTADQHQGAEDLREVVWNSDPMRSARECDVARYSIELPPGVANQVMVKVVEACQRAGLLAFDDRNGALFLPNGKVLPRELAKPWKEFAYAVKHGPRPVTRKEAMRQIAARFNKVLQPLGWRCKGYANNGEGEVFYRVLGTDRQILLLSLLAWGNEFGLQIRFSVFNIEMQRAVSWLKERFPPDMDQSVRKYFIQQAGCYMDDRGQLVDEGGVSLQAMTTDWSSDRSMPANTPEHWQAIEDLLVHKLVPLLQDGVTIRQVNDLLEHRLGETLPGWHRVLDGKYLALSVHDLVLAWLMRAPRLKPWMDQTIAWGIECEHGEASVRNKQQVFDFLLSLQPPDVGQGG